MGQKDRVKITKVTSNLLLIAGFSQGEFSMGIDILQIILVSLNFENET
jgi:hypothetical protein